MTNRKIHEFLICPRCKEDLIIGESILTCKNCQSVFTQTVVLDNCYFTSFASLEFDEIQRNKSLYDASSLNVRYRNFLNWLFLTFNTDEREFRKNLFNDLGVIPGMRLLITGIGNGDDLYSLLQMFPGRQLDIYAQDISMPMCEFTISQLKKMGSSIKEINISNAAHLPYMSDYFDLVFHFGGINWMSEKKEAIHEMVRVAKDGGQIAIIDESVGTWLRDLEYGRMMINNNALWAATVPLDLLPENVNNVRLEFVLENCFYFLRFKKDSKFPNVNIDIKHIGPRGGSIRSRYFGMLEGIDPDLAAQIPNAAKANGLSVYEYLNQQLAKILYK